MPTVYLRAFPEDLHHRSKVRAAIDRTTLKDLVVNALERYLSNEGFKAAEEGAPIRGESAPKDRQPASDAWGIAGTAINNLGQIRPDDPNREEALLRVKAWIENELNWKAVKR